MDARPAGLRQWPDRKAISQGAPQGSRKQGGLQHAPHKRKNVTERENGEGRLDGSQLGGAEATRRPDRRSQTREREPRPTPGENTQGKVGKKSIRTQPRRELEDSTHMRTPKVSSRDGATGSDSNTDRSRGERKAHSQTETVPKRLNSTGNGVKETHRPGERKTITRRRPIRRPSHKEERRMESQNQDRGRFQGTFRKHSYKHLPQGRSPGRRNDTG